MSTRSFCLLTIEEHCCEHGSPDCEWLLTKKRAAKETVISLRIRLQMTLVSVLLLLSLAQNRLAALCITLWTSPCGEETEFWTQVSKELTEGLEGDSSVATLELSMVPIAILITALLRVPELELSFP